MIQNTSPNVSVMRLENRNWTVGSIHNSMDRTITKRISTEIVAPDGAVMRYSYEWTRTEEDQIGLDPDVPLRNLARLSDDDLIELYQTSDHLGHDIKTRNGLKPQLKPNPPMPRPEMEGSW